MKFQILILNLQKFQVFSILACRDLQRLFHLAAHPRINCVGLGLKNESYLCKRWDFNLIGGAREHLQRVICSTERFLEAQLNFFN